MCDARKGMVVVVTSEGQATIPKKFRDKLNIDTPGRVRFVETEDGEVVIRPIKRPGEVRGALTVDAGEDEQSATDLLREERERDKEDRGSPSGHENSDTGS